MVMKLLKLIKNNNYRQSIYHCSPVSRNILFYSQHKPFRSYFLPFPDMLFLVKYHKGYQCYYFEDLFVAFCDSEIKKLYHVPLPNIDKTYVCSPDLENISNPKLICKESINLFWQGLFDYEHYHKNCMLYLNYQNFLDEWSKGKADLFSREGFSMETFLASKGK